MQIIIKELNPKEDLIQFSSLLTDFYSEIEHDMAENADLMQLTSDFQESGSIELAIFNREIIGFISIIESKAIYAGGKYGVINELYVKPQFRSNGVGEKLIHCAYQLKEKLHWNRLELSTPDESKWIRTIKFYERQGFKRTGQRMKK